MFYFNHNLTNWGNNNNNNNNNKYVNTMFKIDKEIITYGILNEVLQ